MVHVIRTLSNHFFVGKLKTIESNYVELDNVYMIYNSTRSDRRDNFCRPQYGKVNGMKFFNFVYLAEADERLKKLYLELDCEL